MVEQDEEVATIETDKIDVTVNSPEAGKILEFFAKEEDTVTVGQDLLKLELGATAEDGTGQAKDESSSKKDKGEPKTSGVKDTKKAENSGKDKKAQQEPPEPTADTAKEENKPTQKEQSPESAAEPKNQRAKDDVQKQQASESQPAMDKPFGNRDEKRVLPSDILAY